MPTINPPERPAVGPCEPVWEEEPDVVPEEAPVPVELPDVDEPLPAPFWPAPVREPARRT